MYDILHGYILNLNENEHFAVDLRSVTVLYFCHDNDGYLSEQQWDYPAC